MGLFRDTEEDTFGDEVFSDDEGTYPLEGEEEDFDSRGRYPDDAEFTDDDEDEDKYLSSWERRSKMYDDIGARPNYRTPYNITMAVVFLLLSVYIYAYVSLENPSNADVVLPIGISFSWEFIQLCGVLASVCLGSFSLLGFYRIYFSTVNVGELSADEVKLLALDASKHKQLRGSSSSSSSSKRSRSKRGGDRHRSSGSRRPGSGRRGRDEMGVRQRHVHVQDARSSNTSFSRSYSASSSGREKSPAKRTPIRGGMGHNQYYVSPDRVQAINKDAITDERSLRRFMNKANGVNQSSTAPLDVSYNATDSFLAGPASPNIMHVTSPTAASPFRSPYVSNFGPGAGAGPSPFRGHGSPYQGNFHSGSPFGAANTSHQSPWGAFSPNTSTLSGYGSHHASPVVPYATSYRAAQDKDTLALEDGFPTDDEKADIYCYDKSTKLLKSLGIADMVPVWEDEMRMWLAREVLVPKVREYHRSNIFFAGLADKLLQQGPNLSEEHRQLLTEKAPVSKFIALMMQFVENEQNFRIKQEVARRRRLERYLEVGGSSSKNYVYQRLVQLSRGGSLSVFKWKSGGEYDKKPWKAHLPTDSKILMHCFCTFMDEVMNFSTNYLITGDEKEEKKTVSSVSIVEKRVNPPYYLIRHKEGKWFSAPGYENVFQTLVLFVYYIKKEMDGRLGNVRLSDASVCRIGNIIESL